jgi:hypothetical protein
MSTDYGNDFPGSISPEDLRTPEDKQAAQDTMTAAVEHWRDEALKAHPAAAPLREYLTADSKAEVMALAEDLAAKLQGTRGGDLPNEPPVPGGSPALHEGTHPGHPDRELDELRLRARRGDTNAAAEVMRRQREAAGWPF